MTENTEINQVNQPNKSNFLKSNWKFLTFISIVIIFGIALLTSQQKGFIGRFTGEFNEVAQVTQQPLEKQECLFECCIDGTYKMKQCLEDYSCENNICKPNDSDNDGLFDYEEKQIGTDPRNPDTDGDSLNDYQEYKIYKTQPTNPNSDGDRYKDGEEIQKGLNPLVKNSANIIYNITNERGDYNWFNIIKDGSVLVVVGGALSVCSAGTLGACAAAIGGTVYNLLNPVFDDVLYTSNFDVVFNNVGDDYTQYINYNVVYKTKGQTITSSTKDAGTLEVGKSKTITDSYEIKLKDIPYALWDFIQGKEIITFDIPNVQYEKY
jgi:hypothetical protein